MEQYIQNIETIYIDGNSESHFNPIGDSIKIYKLFTSYFAKLVLITILNLFVFNLITKIVTLPSIITVTFAIIVANLITDRFRLKDLDIVNRIVYVITLVVLTLILGGITNIAYTLCYLVCMMLSYFLIRVFFE